MESRFNYAENPLGAKAVKHLVSASKVALDSSVPTATKELVSLRISQINGCAPCVEIHTKELEHAGETSLRINLVPVWREAPVYTDAEQAALALAEEGTRVADAAEGVSDETWDAAAKHYDADQLAALVALIAVMNAFNRMNIITAQPAPGSYQPGQW